MFGYGTIFANVAYTLASVPLALHYLGKEEFGLWALAQQIAGYLLLLDFGISSALSRFLADHKDNVNGGKYGSLILTGGVVFFIQGVAIAIAGSILSFFAPVLFSIPPHLANSFSHVLILLSVLSGIGVALRTIGAPLWAFQRLDLVNGLSGLGLILGLATLWVGFQLGWGIYSLALSWVPGMLLSAVVSAGVGVRKGYFPARGQWGQPQWSLFQEIFGFGKDIILMSLGSQLVNATQIMIVSRILGLDAAATFSIATKFATMGQQFAGKILDTSAPGLTEMFIRGENSLFTRRFWDVLAISAALAAMGATALAACNRGIINLWTGGAVQWSATGDLLLGLLLIITVLSRCIVGLFGITKNLQPVRHIFLFEGVTFIGLAIFLAKTFGMNGVLVASILAQLLVTTFLSLMAARPVLKNITPAVRLYVLPPLICFLGWSATIPLSSPTAGWLANLLVLGFVASISGGLALLFVIPSALRSDILRRIPISRFRGNFLL